MSRNRIIYQSLALYAGQNAVSANHTGVGSVKQLSRVQSFDEDFSRKFTDVTQFATLAPIDPIETESPSVNSSFSYFLTDGGNEKLIGLTVSTGAQPLVSCLSGILSRTSDEKNYFLLIADEGSDAAGFVGGTSGVIGLGNAFLTSYSLEAGVGELATATVNLEALNVAVYADADGTNAVPGVNPSNGQRYSNPFVLPEASDNAYAGQITALRHGDVSLSLNDKSFGFAESDLKLQRATLSFDLSRTPQQKLGSKFAFTRNPEFPVIASLSVDAEVGDLKDDDLSLLLCDTGVFDLAFRINKPTCSGDGDAAIIAFLNGAKLSKESLKNPTKDNSSISITFEVALGGPEDLSRGIFLSGSYL